MIPKLIEIPLGPFTTPSGSRNHPCKCYVRFYSTDHDPDCEDCKGTGRVTGNYTPCQRESSEDDRIKPDAHYLVRIECANRKGEYYWRTGQFYKQWYGWSLNVGSHTIQLDSIEGPMYEIVEVEAQTEGEEFQEFIAQMREQGLAT